MNATDRLLPVPGANQNGSTSSPAKRLAMMSDGTFAEVVVVVNQDGTPVAGGTSSSGSSGGGGIIGVDTAGTKWLMTVNATTTPATIKYIKVSDGTAGTPVGGFTPDADQNGLTDAQLRASAVPVSANNVVQSANNSSTAQLAAGATFTGTWDTGNSLSAESVQIMVTSDQAGTLYIDQSQDAAGSVGVQTTSYKVTAGTPFNTNAAIVGKALRVRFTNTGAAATTTLAISTIFTPVMSVLPTTLTQKGSLRIANQESVGATLTQTVVAVPANTATQLVAANANRQYLAIQVIGTTGVSLGFGSAPTVGNGWAIDPASAAGRQGGAVTWDAGVITQQQVQAISSAATTVVVLEGI